jgi:hypothetical protein
MDYLTGHVGLTSRLGGISLLPGTPPVRLVRPGVSDQRALLTGWPLGRRVRLPLGLDRLSLHFLPPGCSTDHGSPIETTHDPVTLHFGRRGLTVR